jgi:hypothetical protein
LSAQAVTIVAPSVEAATPRTCAGWGSVRSVRPTRVPDACQAVAASGHKAISAGKEDDVADHVGQIASEFGKALAGVRIPEAQGKVESRRDDPPPVGAQGEGLDGVMCPKFQEGRVRQQVPELDGLDVGDEEAIPVRAEGERAG